MLLTYARDKTAVDLFPFSFLCLWSIREGGLFMKTVYLFNLPAADQLAIKKILDLVDELYNKELLIDDV